MELWSETISQEIDVHIQGVSPHKCVHIKHTYGSLAGANLTRQDKQMDPIWATKIRIVQKKLVMRR